MNMNDDPSLSGCLIYYLKKGTNKFGCQKESDVSLNSLGIRKYLHYKRQHCVIKNENNQKVSIQVFTDARVILNGVPLEPNMNKPVTLSHLDRLILGIILVIIYVLSQH